MRIVLIGSSLECGGAEQYLTLLANEFARRRYDVTVLTLYVDAGDPFFVLDSNVAFRQLRTHGRTASLPSTLYRNTIGSFRIRSELKISQPDAVISFLNWVNVVVLLSSLGLKRNVFAIENSNPLAEPESYFLRLLKQFAYPRAAAVVVQTQALLDAFPFSLGTKGAVIPGAVESPEAGFTRVPDPSRRQIVSLGRLVSLKQIDHLIQAFGAIAPEFPHWELAIWGDGPERSKLEALASSLGLDTSVKFYGATSSKAEVFRSADLFVLTSAYEGYGLALAEALAHGVPAISYDCQFGPAEIIRADIDGLLVPAGDLDRLTQALSTLMRDETRRVSMSARATEVLDRCGIAAVVTAWEQLIAERLAY